MKIQNLYMLNTEQIKEILKNSGIKYTIIEPIFDYNKELIGILTPKGIRVFNKQELKKIEKYLKTLPEPV